MRKSFFEPSLYKTWLKSYRLIGILLTLGVSVVALIYQSALAVNLRYMENPQPYKIAFFITDFSTSLYLSLAAMAAALVMSAACFRFVHDSRECDLLHGMPAKRSSIFLSATAAAFTLLLPPLLLSTLLFGLIMAAHGLFAPMLLLTYFVMMLGCAVLAFGITTFAAMLTGKTAIQGVIVLLICTLPLVIEAFARVYVQRFFFGFYQGQNFVTESINPFFLLSNFLSDTSADFWEQKTPNLWGYILFMLAGIGLAICAFLLYRRRPSESAGEVFAVKILRPVTQVICGLLCAAILYSLLIHVFPFIMSHIALEILINVFGVFLGCWGAKALLSRTIRTSPFSKKSISLAAALAVLLLCMNFDITGFNRFQLSAENVSYITTAYSSEAVDIAMHEDGGTAHSDWVVLGYDLTDDTHFIEDLKKGISAKMPPAIAAQILAQDAHVFSGAEAADAILLQQMLSDSYEKLRPTFDMSREVPGEIARYVPITAKLTDGTVIERRYSFRYRPEEMPELSALLERVDRQNDVAYIQNTERVLGKATALRVGISGNEDRDSFSAALPPDDWNGIEAAYLADMQAGLSVDLPVDKNGYTIDNFAFIGVTIEGEEYYGYPIWYTYENTIAWLIEHDYTTKEVFEDNRRRVMTAAGLE